jgi:hypothetical protein
VQYVTDDKKRVTVAIPIQLHTKLIDAGIGVTEGIIKGLELLLEPKANDASSSDEMRVNDLLDRISDLHVHNETLIKELEKAAQDKENLQNIYNNYFLQVQTLINQKAIEAPGAKKPWYKFW